MLQTTQNDTNRSEIAISTQKTTPLPPGSGRHGKIWENVFFLNLPKDGVPPQNITAENEDQNPLTRKIVKKIKCCKTTQNDTKRSEIAISTQKTTPLPPGSGRHGKIWENVFFEPPKRRGPPLKP